jgi:hypothetical protein
MERRPDDLLSALLRKGYFRKAELSIATEH